MSNQSDRTAITASGVMKALEPLAFSIKQEEAHSLARHLQAVLDRNQTLNLTRITDPDEAVRLHIVDSVTALPFVRDAQDGPVVDIGSGAGYPGVPIAILTNRQVTLVESVKKKAAFLQEVCEDLGLSVLIEGLRAEELALRPATRFSVVTARAVSSLPSLVELAAPLLAKGGLLLAMKGSPTADELQAGDHAAAQCGLSVGDLHHVRLPVGDEVRSIVCYRAIANARVPLPRRPGMAQRHPLA